MDPVARTDMRARAAAYPEGSPERDAYIAAIVRHTFAKLDTMMDESEMRLSALGVTLERGRA